MANMTVYWALRDKEKEHILFLPEEHLHLKNHFQYIVADPPTPNWTVLFIPLREWQSRCDMVLGNISCAFIHKYSMAQIKRKKESRSLIPPSLISWETWGPDIDQEHVK